MKNATLFTPLFLSCLFYIGCSTEEQAEAPQKDKTNLAPRMISSRTPDASMLAAVGLSGSEPNAKMAQLYNEEDAVVAVYESVPEVEFLFIH